MNILIFIYLSYFIGKLSAATKSKRRVVSNYTPKYNKKYIS